jgi:hypothetical protein
MQPTPTRSPTFHPVTFSADGFDDAGDLMADGQREVRLAPFVADGVDVAVADARRPDVDDDIVGTRIASLDGCHTKTAGPVPVFCSALTLMLMCSPWIRIFRNWAPSSSA